MSETRFYLILVSTDPIFRVGLKTVLESFDEFQILIDTENTQGAINLLLSGLQVDLQADLQQADLQQADLQQADLQQADSNSAIKDPNNSLKNSQDSPNAQVPIVVLVDWNFERSSIWVDLLRWQRLKVKYPRLKVLSLGFPTDSLSLDYLKDCGGDGFCQRGGSIEQLRIAIERVASGQTRWPVVVSPPTRVKSAQPAPGRKAGVFWQWLYGLCQSGLNQVDLALQEGLAELGQSGYSWVDRQLMAGQHRELKFVRWMLQKWTKIALNAIPNQNLVVDLNGAASIPAKTQLKFDLDPAFSQSRVQTQPVFTDDASNTKFSKGVQQTEHPSGALLVLPPNIAPNQDLQTIVFDQIINKLHSNLRNLTSVPLEIDILSLSKRRELMLIILDCLGDLLAEIRQSQITPENLRSRTKEIPTELWKTALTQFFGQYETLDLTDQRTDRPARSARLNGPLQAPLKRSPGHFKFVPQLLEAIETVETVILNQVVYPDAILQTLVFETPLTIDGVAYRPHSPETLTRLIQLTENLIIQVANAIIQPLLNQFSTIEILKQLFYNQRLLSTRQVERFRNNLSWKYRFAYYFEEPRNIYESRYWLFHLNQDGISRIAIYAPRQLEMQELSGFQQTITLSLELRDAIAPRLQALTAWLGTGVVYVLTHVIGRAIGLIGKGILQGIGSSWQDSRFNRKNQPDQR